jgi:hypothetical protein
MIVQNREFGFIEFSVEGGIAVKALLSGDFFQQLLIQEPALPIAPFSTKRTKLDALQGAGFEGAGATGGGALDESSAVSHCGCVPLHTMIEY